MSQRKQSELFYQERLARMRRMSFPQTAEAILAYLALIGDVYRLREGVVSGADEPELDMVQDFFNTVTPEMIDSALSHVCGRSTSEVATQPDVDDAKALGTFVTDRDRLVSIKIALNRLCQCRRWSKSRLLNLELFEHALQAYDAWLQNQYVAHGIGASDIPGLLGERSVLGFSSRSV